MLEYLLVPALVLLGLITSYEDVNFGRIRNKWITSAFVYVLAVYLAFFLFLGQAPEGFLDNLLLNAAFALGTAVILWLMGFWGAGDAKLFFVYSLLIPPLFAGGFAEMPFVDLLINTFVPAGIFVIGLSVTRIDKEQAGKQLKQMFRPEQVAAPLLLLFVLNWALYIILQSYPSQQFAFLFTLLTVLAMFKARDFMGRKGLWLLAVVAIVRVVVDPAMYDITTWKNLVGLALIFVVLRLLFVVIQGGMMRSVRLKDVSEDMMPAELIVMKDGKYQAAPYGSDKAKAASREELVFPADRRYLTSKDVKSLKSLAKKQKGLKELKVQESISFAPFLFLGAVLQILLQDNLISGLSSLLSLL